MRKRLIAKGNLHPSDHLRALVTDTQPGDVPIIVSNDGFYRNLKRKSVSSSWQEVVDAIVRSKKNYTKPYRYNIVKSDGGVRRLSLTHPSSQREVSEFYAKFGHLICHFCRKSPASLRAPEKVGGMFFVREDSNRRDRLKGAPVDTTDIEHTVSNPASYFAYRGINRLHKFFGSTDYLRLEKRYSVMKYADVSKCFSSIYTHTLFWATADQETAKSNTGAHTFANSFDKLMQSMNYNETNGICIGAEVSRIFAEIILSEVDRRVVSRLEALDRPLSFRTHYEFRRYVDDYYLFAESEAVAKTVESAVAAALSDFNLHLSADKGGELKRPFITEKSRLIREADAALVAFFGRFLDVSTDETGTYLVPKRIWNQAALLRSLLDSIKAVCYDLDAGYESVSNYVIGALATRTTVLSASFEKVAGEGDAPQEQYLAAILLLLEALYFFYTVHPSVPSSLRVAQSALQALHVVRSNLAVRSEFIGEQLVRWTFQFLKSLQGSTAHTDSDCVLLEAINALLVLGELDRNDAVSRALIVESLGGVRAPNYFEIVCFLFCMKDSAEFAAERAELMQRAAEIILAGGGVAEDAEAAHLALDILACPFLPANDRADLLGKIRVSLGLPALLKADLVATIRVFEEVPWFVNWNQIDLLSMIRKKELSAVY